MLAACEVRVIHTACAKQGVPVTIKTTEASAAVVAALPQYLHARFAMELSAYCDWYFVLLWRLRTRGLLP